MRQLKMDLNQIHTLVVGADTHVQSVVEQLVTMAGHCCSKSCDSPCFPLCRVDK